MSITVADNVFLLGDKTEDCPTMFDPGTFKKTYTTYMTIMNSHMSTPTIEYIFDKVETYVVEQTQQEIKERVMAENPGVSEFLAVELATSAAEVALKDLKEGIYQEVEDILVYRGLAYQSNSKTPEAHLSHVFNSPQISVLERKW